MSDGSGELRDPAPSCGACGQGPRSAGCSRGDGDRSACPSGVRRRRTADRRGPWIRTEERGGAVCAHAGRHAQGAIPGLRASAVWRGGAVRAARRAQGDLARARLPEADGLGRVPRRWARRPPVWETDPLAGLSLRRAGRAVCHWSDSRCAGPRRGAGPSRRRDIRTSLFCPGRQAGTRLPGRLVRGVSPGLEAQLRALDPRGTP